MGGVNGYGFPAGGAMALVILIGSVWGFIEALVGGALHAVSSPISGSLMAPIGFGVLAYGAKRGLRAQGIVCAAIVAAFFKFLDPIIFTMPIFHIRIINPAQAIFSQGIAFVVGWYAVSRVQNKSRIPKMAMIIFPIAIILFNFISYFVVGYKETGHLLNVQETLVMKIPLGVMLTMITMYGAENAPTASLLRSNHWSYMTSGTLAVLTIFVRVWMF